MCFFMYAVYKRNETAIAVNDKRSVRRNGFDN